MPAVHNHIRRHRPLITPRIEFQLAPRPPLPILTARMEFDIPTPADSSSSGSEETPSPSPSRRQSPIHSAPDTEEDPDPEMDRSSSPLPQPAPTTTQVPTPLLIPKPRGEPGRPRCGGFNLEDTLKDVHNWSKKDIDDLNIFLRKEATRTLNMNVSFQSQKKGLIDRICEKASGPDLWPALANYENCWPVRSALKLILKYQVQASRRNDDKGVATRLRRAVEGDKRELSKEL